MKRNQRRFLLLVTAVLVAGVAWAADSARSRSDQRTLADAALELRVKTALLTKIGWDMIDVDVEADDGAVWLGGETESRSHQELATEVARSVEGVRSVDNHLKLEDSESSEGGRTPVADTVGKGVGKAESEVRDAILESRVKTALIDAVGSTAFRIEVEATDGKVSLRGDLDDKRKEDLALDTARHCRGVTKVIDLIRVSG